LVDLDAYAITRIYIACNDDTIFVPCEAHIIYLCTMYRVLSIVPLVKKKHGSTQLATSVYKISIDGSKIAGLWIKLVGLSPQPILIIG
jgi:hypothetical protein